MSFTDLGKATGLSTSAVHQRVKRLEKRGLIKGYGATIDHDRLGLPLTGVHLDPAHRPLPARRLTRAPPQGIREIESCWSVAGDESYILKIRVPHPRRPRGPPGPIRFAANVSTRTTIVLSTPYEGRSVV